ncbi:FKBP6-like protein [Mya arenaria]|uniref:peptidylprolyl isomerase n=1 Tax=Mya arenaria TaxID=6604 RepID=A0ABY7E1M0_MYAAR|nr:FKBP6-like protein [Mya arenaria]
MSVCLKEGLDLQDLRATAGKNESQGVIFEVAEEDAPLGDEEYEAGNFYKGEELCENMYHDSDEEDEDDESTPFEKIARKMEDVCPDKDGGILKQQLKHGVGTVVPTGSLVRFHYNAFLELRNRVAKLRLGQGEMIEGVDVALSTMRKSELSRFLIKPEYNLGERGAPPRIPPNSTMTWDDLNKLYHMITKEAKELFQEGRYRQAFPKYKKACTLLENRRLSGEEEEREVNILLLRVFQNLALCCIKLAHSGRAIVYCKKYEQLDRKPNAKVLYLRGKAHSMQCDFETARDYLKKANKIKPNSKDIIEELEKLERNMIQYKFDEKAMYRKMFSKPKGDTPEEVEKENARDEEKKTKSLACSDRFRQMVQEKLESFKANPELTDFPMPSYNMTVGEIECIMETADNLGLHAKLSGSGNSTQLRVMKKIPSGTS